MRILFYILLLCFLSCDYFEKKRKDLDQVIKEKTVDLDRMKVDRYPIFKSCERIDQNIEKEKTCFLNTLSSLIADGIEKRTALLKNSNEAKVTVLIEIDTTGKIQIQSIKLNEIIKEKIPAIDSLIKQSILDLPEIKPALKRITTGNIIEEVSVKTQFLVPLKLVTK